MMLLVRPFGLLLAPALLSVPTADIVFAPEEGSEINVEFAQVFSVEMVDMTLAFNDEEVDISEMGTPEFTLRDEESIEYTDTIVKSGDGHPAVVHRHYDELTKLSTQTGPGPDGDEVTEEDPGSSELEGMTVAFTWDGDEEEYVASFAEDEGDEDLLEDLAFNGYMWEVLASMPEETPEEGDRWEVDVIFFNELTEPCGDVSFVLESAEDDEDEDDDWGEQFADNLDGEFFVEYGGVRDEDGTEVVVLILTAEVTTEIVKEIEIDEDAFSGTTTSTFSFDFESEGELLWNAATNQPFALTFNGDVGFEIEETLELSGDEGEMKRTTVQSFEGTVEVSASYN